jgi:hypothetical protein
LRWAARERTITAIGPASGIDPKKPKANAIADGEIQPMVDPSGSERLRPS